MGEESPEVREAGKQLFALTFERDLTILESVLAKKTDNAQKLSVELQKERTRYQQLQKDNQLLLSERAKFTELLDASVAKSNQLQQQAQQWKEHCELLEKNHRATSKELEELDIHAMTQAEQIIRLEKQVEELTGHNQELQGSLERTQRSLAGAQQRLLDSERRVMEADAATAEVRHAKERADAKVRELTQQLEASQEAERQLRQGEAEQRAALEAAKLKYENSLLEMSNAGAKYAGGPQTDALKERIMKLKAEVSSLKTELAQARGESRARPSSSSSSSSSSWAEPASSASSSSSSLSGRKRRSSGSGKGGRAAAKENSGSSGSNSAATKERLAAARTGRRPVASVANTGIPATPGSPAASSSMPAPRSKRLKLSAQSDVSSSSSSAAAAAASSAASASSPALSASAAARKQALSGFLATIDDSPFEFTY